MFHKGLISIILLILYCWSCQKPEPPQVNLSYTKRKIIDSMFKEQLPELDSLYIKSCEERRDEILGSLVDSLYEVRMKEIEDIKQKNQ